MTDSRAGMRRTAGGLAWTLVGAAAHILFQIAALAALGRLLTPEDFGVVAAALVAVNFSAVFAQIGVNQALIQRPALPPQASGTAFLISFGLGTALATALALLAPVIAVALGLEALTPVLRALAVIFPLRALGSTAEALLARSLRFRAIALLDLASYAIGYGAVGVTLAAMGFGTWSLVASHLAQATLRSVLAFAACPHRLRPDLDATLVRDLLTFGGGVTLARVANYVALQADNLVVARQLGAAAVGAYSRAYQLMGMPAGLVGNALDRVLFPVFAQRQGEVPVLRDAYLLGSSLIALACLPAGAVASVAAPELVRVVLGGQWDEVVVPFQVFALTLVFRVGDRLNAITARAVGAVYRRALLQVAYAATVIALAVVGSQYGLIGVAVGVAVALCGNQVLGTVLATRLLDAPAGNAVRAFVVAAPLTAVTAAAAMLGAWPGRTLGWPPSAVMASSLLAAAGIGAFILWRFPRPVMGSDARRLAGMLVAVAPARAHWLRRWAASIDGTGS